MERNTEIELKFLVDKKDLEKLLKSDCLKIQPNSEKVRRLVSSYYDTEDFAFKNNGIAYRVRDKGDGSFEATVKTNKKSAAGISERLELNLPLASATPVLEGFEELGLDQSLRLLAPNGVIKLFTVDVERTTYILLEGDSKIEMAVDLGKIKARSRKTDSIDEVELELLEGEKDDLLKLAERIAKAIPLFVEKRSKFARGLALIGQTSDLVTGKEKMRGPVRRELLKMTNFHGDVLLELQNHLRKLNKQDDKEEMLLLLQKRLGFLDSYLELITQISTAPETYKELTVIEEKWSSLVEEWLVLEELKQEWDHLKKLDPALSKNDALKKLLEKEQIVCEEKLQEGSSKGELTQLVYGILVALEREELPNEDFLQADAIVADFCNKLQQKLLELMEMEKRAFVQEQKLLGTMLCLSKSVKGKRFGHLNESWKKQEKNARELALWQKELLTLQGWLKQAEDKLLIRNLGILYGSLL